ncbi:MAG: DUF721 domain-containing protein [Cycloclasticus sp.]|nr:DUF721 domain-containing protein [Cycloclasticus sp.]
MFKRPFKHNIARLSGLQHIQQALSVQQKLLQVVQESLNAGLAQHCLHVTVRSKKATLSTDSSIWASKLLYMRSIILAALSEHLGDEVRILTVKVRPSQTTKQLKLPNTPSRATLNVLSNANPADSSDSLSLAMNKLIRALSKPSIKP